MRGSLVTQKVLKVERSGVIRDEIVFDPPLSPGMYFIDAGPTIQLRKKMIVVR